MAMDVKTAMVVSQTVVVRHDGMPYSGIVLALEEDDLEVKCMSPIGQKFLGLPRRTFAGMNPKILSAKVQNLAQLGGRRKYF